MYSFSKSALWAVFLMAIFILAACGGDKGENSESKPEDGEAPFVMNLDPAEIIFYAGTGANENTFNFRVADEARKKFPHYTITQLEPGNGGKLNELITTNTRFDIYFHTIGNFEAAVFPYGFGRDMTDLIKRHQVDTSIIEPTIMEAAQQSSGGSLFGLPVYSESLVMFYNKELFRKFGVPFPEDGMLWDDMIALSQRLTRVDNGVQYFGFAQSNVHSLRMNPLSVGTADVKTDIPLINKDDKWKRVVEDFFLKPTQVPGYQDALKERKSVLAVNSFTRDRNVAMFAYMASSLMIQNQADLEGMDWDMVALPTFSSQKGIGSQAYPAYFGVTSMAQNPDASMAVIKYLVSESFQIESARKGITPVLNSSSVQAEFGKSSPYQNKNFKAIFHNKLAPIPAKPLYDATLVSTYNTQLTQLMLGNVDVNTALRTAEEEALKKIDEYKAQQR